MAVEEELKKDHSDMQAVVDSKQKIIEAQVRLHHLKSVYKSLRVYDCRSDHILPSDGGNRWKCS